MTVDRRLEEAIIKEAARHARGFLHRAVTRLETVARATGDTRFEELIPELEQFKQRIRDAEEGDTQT